MICEDTSEEIDSERLHIRSEHRVLVLSFKVTLASRNKYYSNSHQLFHASVLLLTINCVITLPTCMAVVPQ